MWQIRNWIQSSVAFGAGAGAGGLGASALGSGAGFGAGVGATAFGLSLPMSSPNLDMVPNLKFLIIYQAIRSTNSLRIFLFIFLLFKLLTKALLICVLDAPSPTSNSES